MTDRMARAVAPAALAAFVIVGILLTHRPAALAVPVGAAVILLGGALAWRGVAGWPFAAGLVAAAIGVAVLGHEQSSNVGWFGVCVLAGWVALVAPTVEVGAVVAALIAVLVGQWLNQTDEPGWASWITGTVFTMVACVLVQRQQRLVVQLEETQADLADRARAEERNRIAAEMHDVIGHALTVSLLHVSSARLALDDVPEQARASLAEAERLTQQSLAEVRAAVGLMRVADPSSVAPMPAAGDVAELVESFRAAGTPVELAIEGDLGSIGATRGLALYRIVQESLTNAARHSAEAATTVCISAEDEATTVTVTSSGTPNPEAMDGAGVLGMRERAETLGGRLLAGPCENGWRVEAVLPS
jgi:signal transduction histidine kinase